MIKLINYLKMITTPHCIIELKQLDANKILETIKWIRSQNLYIWDNVSQTFLVNTGKFDYNIDYCGQILTNDEDLDEAIEISINIESNDENSSTFKILCKHIEDMICYNNNSTITYKNKTFSTPLLKEHFSFFFSRRELNFEPIDVKEIILESATLDEKKLGLFEIPGYEVHFYPDKIVIMPTNNYSILPDSKKINNSLQMLASKLNANKCSIIIPTTIEQDEQEIVIHKE